MFESSNSLLIILLTIFIAGGLVYYYTSGAKRFHNDGVLIENETDHYIDNYYGYDTGKKKTTYGKYNAEDGETTNYVEGDNNTFLYNKKKYKIGSLADIKNKYNPENLLPKEKNNEWFDTDFLMDNNNELNESQLIHPTKFMDQNTILGSRKGMSYDIRGDVPNPKVYRPIFGDSVIEPSLERNGLCNY